jgi:DNA-binding GntR family transcriptional regulator
VLAELYESVLWNVRSNIQYNFQQMDGDTDAHEVIVEAIVARDATTAARAIEGYLGAMAALLPPESGPSPGRVADGAGKGGA